MRVSTNLLARRSLGKGGCIAWDSLPGTGRCPPRRPFGEAGRPTSPTMKTKITIIVLAAGLLCAGCSTTLTLSGQLQRPGQTIGGALSASTNALTLSGDYQTGSTNVTGTIGVQK